MLILLIAALAFQLPPSEVLSPEDAKGFHEEIARLEKLLTTASDRPAVIYALARTYAAGGQYREAVEWLNKAVGLNAGLDPVNDRQFEAIHNTREWFAILHQIRDSTPAIVNSHVAFNVEEENLAPEGMAYDAARKRFFIGSTRRHKIVECTESGDCRIFAQGLGEVLGIKVSPLDGSVWAASNAKDEADLFHFTAAGALLRKYAVAQGHYFNDLAINAAGDVFVTDTRAGRVLLLAHATDRLEILNPALHVESANGIALSDDGKKVYVAGFPDGLTVVDLPSRAFRAVAHPESLCLATIDGLAFFQGSLIAIQNGIMTHRVVRLNLGGDGNSISSFEILERRNPLFEGITTGAVALGAFYFMANTDTLLHPTTILKLPLRR
jgi:DNA-binding beta-propeller fold protein YncE